MVVALGIGLSIVQKSLVDISTSGKVEDSSRAFSAAEAGIEKALRETASGRIGSVSVDFTENNSRANVMDTGLLPCIPGASCPPGVTTQPALEYPPLAKEEVTHVWLADYTSTSNPPPLYYAQPTLDVYWGNSGTDQAALELTLVYYAGGIYQSKKWYFESSASRAATNGFTLGTCSGNHTPTGGANTYQCKTTITGLLSDMMLLRARLLYNTASQPFAVQSTATSVCSSGCYLPSQARKFESTGFSGQTQRKVEVFQINKVVPPYFDYAIFSAGEIRK